MDDFLKIGMGFDYKAIEDSINKVNSLLGKGFNDVFININTKNIDKEIASIDTKLKALNKSRDVLLKIKNPSANEIKLLADLESRITELTTEKQINLSIKTAATTSLKDIKKQVEELTAKRNEIQLGLASEDLSKKLDEVNEKVKEITDKKAKVQLELEEANFSKQIKDVDKTIKLLEKKQLALKFDPDNSPKELQKQFESFTREIDKLKTKKVSIELEATNAQKKIDFFDKKLKGLDDEKITLSADTDKASKELDEIDKQLDNLEAVKKIKLQIDEKNIATVNSALNNIAKIGAAAFIGIGVATASLSAGMFCLATAASDAQESTSKLYNVFNDVSTANVSNAVNELTRSYGFAKSEADELLGSTGNVLAGIGFVGDEALQTSLEINKLAADLVSFTNYSGGVAGASEILTKAFLGERDALTSLGIKISEEEVKTQMLAMGYQNLTGQAEALAKAEATLELIYIKGGKALGDYERTAQGFANQQRLSTALLKDLAVTIGDMILPYLEELIREFNQAVIKITDFVKNNEKLKDAFKNLTTSITNFLRNGLDKVLDSVPDIIDNFAKFADTIAFLVSNLNIIVPVLSGVAASMVAVKVALIAINAGLIGFNALTGGIVIAIGALVTALVLLIMNWNTVREVAEKALINIEYYAKIAWEALKGGALIAIDAVKSGFLSLASFIAEKTLPMVSSIIEPFEKLGKLNPFKDVQAALDKSVSSMKNLANASKTDLDSTIKNTSSKIASLDKERKARLASLNAEVKATESANEKIKKSNAETQKEAEALASTATTSTATADTTKANKERVDSLQDTLNKELVLEKQALEVKKQLIANEVADEIEKNKQIEEAEEASQERRRALLEKSLFEYSASGGDIETLQITQEASITGDATTATEEYKALGGEIEAVTEKTATLAEIMRSAFGGSMFDGLDSQIQNAIKSFDGLASKSQEAIGKFATSVSAITLNTASYVSELWGAITDLQNQQLEAQLENLESNYDSQLSALDSKYEAEQEKLDEDYNLQNEKLEEQLEKQDEINNEHQEMLDELQAERDELEAEKQAIMDEEDYEALQQKIKDKEAQIAAEKKALADGEKTHANLLAKQEADEAAYNASKETMDLNYETQKYELERQYAIKKAELERKQAEQTKALNIFNASLALAQGIAQAVVAGMASGFPLVFVPLYTALAATLGGIQLATAISTPLPSIPAYADGGVVSKAFAGNYGAYGLTPPNSKDNTLAWVGTNERVLTETQNRNYESMLNSNNSNSTVNNYDIQINNVPNNVNTKGLAKLVIKEIGGKI